MDFNYTIYILEHEIDEIKKDLDKDTDKYGTDIRTIKELKASIEKLCEGNPDADTESGLHLADVSASFLDELQLKVNYHMNSEKDRASEKDYRGAIYHSTCAGAITDVILMAKRKNER